MILSSVIWNVNPEIANFFGFSLRYYGILFAFTFIFGNIIMEYLLKKESRFQVNTEALLLYIVLGTVIGARLGHVIFYGGDYYLQNPGEIVEMWHGGLASHGGGLGILIALLIYTKRYTIPFLWITIVWLFL